MRTALTGLLLAALAAPLSAQYLPPAEMGFISKQAFGVDGAHMRPAELDGDPSTREWVGWYYGHPKKNGLWVALSVDRFGRGCTADFAVPIPDAPDEWFYVNPETAPGQLTVIDIQSSAWQRSFPVPLPVCQ